MEGRIFNIQRFSVHDGPGARTTVFFKGCNLKCLWCHNPESISNHPVVEFYPQKCIGCGECFKICKHKGHFLNEKGEHKIDRDACEKCLECADSCYSGAIAPVGKNVSTDYVMKQIESDMPYYETSDGGVTFSGGECMLQTDFLAELLMRCKEKGIHTAVDTAGNVSWECFEKIIPYTDLFLFDVKAAESDVHKKLTGVGNELILDNLKKLSEKGARIFVRIPFIPSFNENQMEKIADILKPISPERVEIMPYHKLGLSKYAALDIENQCLNEETPPEKETERIIKIFNDRGIYTKKS